MDVAALPFDGDTLKVTFTLRVLGNLTQPSACNDQDYQEALATVINDYQTQNGFKELATRYATNIANGRFLWRNRIGAEAVEVRVSRIKNDMVENQWIFDGATYSLRNFFERTPILEELAEFIPAGTYRRRIYIF